MIAHVKAAFATLLVLGAVVAYFWLLVFHEMAAVLIFVVAFGIALTAFVYGFFLNVVFRGKNVKSRS